MSDARLAQAQEQGQKPTLKDRLDTVVSEVTGSPMADLDMKHVLEVTKQLDPKRIPKLSTPGCAQTAQQRRRREGIKEQGKSTMPMPRVTVKDMTYETAGTQQPVRIYTPDGAQGPLPVAVYYHGGGFVVADIDTYYATPRAIAKAAQAIVVAVEY